MANMNWIRNAVKKSGAFKAKAEEAKESTKEFAKEKAGAPSVEGKEARLAQTLAKLRGRKGKK